MPVRHPAHFAIVIVAGLLSVVIPAAGCGAEDTTGSMFSVHGFGTVGEVHADASNADFVGSYFQPNGAGYSGSWASGVDSKIGLQGGVRLSDELSATVQVVSQHNYDNSWTPQVDWANVKFQFTPDLSVRAGRTVSDFFMLSDTRFVGYTYPWVRPPEEIYGESPVINQDGVGLNYRLHVGSATSAVNVTYGEARVKIPGGGEANTAERFFAGSNTLELGSFSMRVGYTSLLGDFHSAELDSLFDGFAQLGNAAAGSGLPLTATQSRALGGRYRPTGFRYSIASAGVNYDPGDWLLMTELVKVSATTAIPDSVAWYVTGAHRFGKFTPYATAARLHVDTKSDPGISTTGLPPSLAAGAAGLNAGLNAVFGTFARSQQSLSVGARWDFVKFADLKMQYDRVRLGADSIGRLDNIQPAFQRGGTVNVSSVTLDFVF